MATTFDFTWTDILMTIGGHLIIILIALFILLSDVGATIRSFPASNVREMIKESIPTARNTSAK